MEASKEDRPLQLLDIRGLNERFAEPLTPENSAPLVEGLYPAKIGLLERVNGKKLLHKFDSQIVNLSPSYISGNTILIQTSSALYLATVDELYSRTPATDLEDVDLIKEEDMSLAILQYREPAGTDATPATVANTWTQRKINTVVINETAFVTLSANRFTLPAGSYRIEIFATSHASVEGNLQVYNVTDAAAVAGCIDSTGSNNRDGLILIGAFSIASSKEFEIQHKANGNQAGGMGIARNITATEEVYMIVKLLRVSA